MTRESEPVLTALREKHRQHVHRDGCHRWFDHDANKMLDQVGPSGWCDGCEQDWPCDTTRALNRESLSLGTPSQPVPSGLDEAWAAAEAALPKGWTLEVGDWRAEPNRPEGIAPFEAVAQPYVRQHDGNDPMVIGRSHDGPAAALRYLAAALTAPVADEDPA